MSDRRQAPPIETSPMKPMPKLIEETLANGVNFKYFSSGQEPVCRLVIYFEGGTHELKSAHLPSFITSLIFQGTELHSADEIADAMEFNGVQFEPYPSSHCCGLSFKLLTDRLKEVLPIIKEIIERPAFPEYILEAHKQRCVARLEMVKSQVLQLAVGRISEMIYGPEYPNFITSTPEEIEAISRDELVNVYQRMRCSGKTHIFLAGKLSEGDIDSVRDFALDLKLDGDGYDQRIIEYQSQDPQKAYVLKEGAVQSAVLVGAPTISRTHKDYHKLRLTIVALGGYFGSRLMKNIREDKGLTYSISASLMGSADGAAFMISAQTDPSEVDTVLDEINKEMKLLVTNPPCGEELNRLKLYASTDLLEAVDSPFEIMGFATGKLTAGIPDDYFENQQKAILSLTPDDISMMAREYLDPSMLRIVVAGPENNI